MQCSGTFAGQFIVDGEVDAVAVKVFVADGQASFTSETGNVMLRRKVLYLHPFNRFVMFTQDASKLAKGAFLEISGTNIGALVDGPLGHPGDNENTYGPVANARITTAHSREGMQVSIQGLATRASPDAALSSFNVWFRIPLDAYQSFFCLSQETQQHVESLYAKQFGAA